MSRLFGDVIPSAGPSPARLVLSSVSVLALIAAPAFGQGPVGGTVSQGSATIAGSGAETRISQSSQRAVIDWTGFDVSRDHKVIFDQPGRSAATLNRVTGGQESVIVGRITAPGTVIIQNSAGVLFSGDAKVDVGSLIATNQIVEADRFQNTGALIIGGAAAVGSRVRNEGTITVGEAGLAALVGPHVSNAGSIVAQRGEVALASGAVTTIDLSGDGVARLMVSGDAPGGSQIDNSGTIVANGGRVMLSAGAAAGLLDSVINTTGLIRASAAEAGTGTVELVARGGGTLRSGGRIEAGGAVISGETVTIAAPVHSEGTIGTRVAARQDLTVEASLRADSGDIALSADSGNVTVRGQTGPGLAVVSSKGDVAVAAPRGSVRIESAATGVTARAPQGRITIDAGAAIALAGSTTAEGGSVWVGGYNDATAISMNAAFIDITSGAQSRTPAAVVAGEGGGITLTASERLALGHGGGDVARIVAANGATLTLAAPLQSWDGRVIAQGRDGGLGGGDVILSGTITTGFGAGPAFDLAPDADFVLMPTGPDGATSSLTSLRGFRVTTQGSGTVEIGAPLQAANILMTSQTQVGIGIDGSVSTTCNCDSLVIAAGSRFRNDAGEDAVRVDNPDGRWLVFIDPLDGLDGTAPTPRDFDLYGRPYAENPSLVGFAGNRIVYGERPLLTVTADTLAKTYGVAVPVGATVSGARPADVGAGLLDGEATASSNGAPASADAGVYATLAEARLSERAAIQGYDLQLIDGTLTVTPAPLTITAEDASRAFGAPNPGFDARFDGFVPGEGVTDLAGSLGFDTDAGPASAPGGYTVTPGGLTSGNYAIRYVPGTLTVTAPPTVDGDRSFISSVERFRRGKPPLTPGDASFRTTLAEAGPAIASPFELTYSLGDVQQATVETGFIPASAPIESATNSGSQSVNLAGESCGGPIRIEGSPIACQMVSVRETYWSTVAETRRQD